MCATTNNSIHHHNLPAPLNTFIGRKQEIAEVKNLLSEHRLLTLTGPGGCGKTRLALRVAGELLGDYNDGIWLTEFASLATDDLISQAVAAILNVREQVGSSISESLTSHLQSREVLLVFDNCEHLAVACARLSVAILESCPHVRLLATSREPLGVPGEAVYIVPPLSLPDPQPWRSPTSEHESFTVYQQSEAIQLFVARAAAALPAFKLTAENGPWVADICRRLDGIPLAIELAAARIRAFSVRQMTERLHGRFQLLTSTLRTTTARHQTLMATLDWSYALLATAEQKALQRLSIFANGWMLEAAEAVCADADIGSAEVMDVLSNLVDKSLVMVDKSCGDRRYRLLETIRQYAAQKLKETGEADAIRDRHLSYFRQWAETGETHLTGPDQPGWLEQFDAEHDNLRAALEWSHTTKGRAEAGLRLARACGHFWRLRGYFSEGRARLAAALSQPGAPQRTEVHAWALLWAANLAYMQSDYVATRTLAEEGLAVSRELGSAGRPGVARALDILGELATEVGDYETASDLLTKALAIYRELDERRGIADMLLQLGWAAMRSGHYDQAKGLLNESLPWFRELGESASLGLVLAGLGELAIRQGRYEEANALLQESLVLRRELGDRWGIAALLGSLGWAALRQRDFERTREMLQQSLTIRREIGDRGGIAWCLEKLAEAFALQALTLPASYRQRANRRAVRLLGAAAALRDLLNSVIDPVDQPEYERFLKDLRRTLGSKAYETAWNEGGDISLRGIVDLILTPLLSSAEADSLSNAQATKLKFGGLSPREREAANLIAQGKTNREIAEIMFVRVKTVETYVTRILNKLGFDSRVQIATWALETGLIDMNPEG